MQGQAYVLSIVIRKYMIVYKQVNNEGADFGRLKWFQILT